MTDNNICPHCHMDKRIRNPSGYCDHLYYPESCDICKQRESKKEVTHLISILEKNKFVSISHA